MSHVVAMRQPNGGEKKHKISEWLKNPDFPRVNVLARYLSYTGVASSHSASSTEGIYAQESKTPAVWLCCICLCCTKSSSSILLKLRQAIN